MSNILTVPLITMRVATSNDSDWRMSFAVTIPDDDAVQQPVDLRDIMFLLRVWRLSGGHEIFLSSEDDMDAVTISGTDYNIVNVVFLVDRMARVPVGTWPFEIIVTGDGATLELVNGTIVHGTDGGSIITSMTAVSRNILETETA